MRDYTKFRLQVDTVNVQDEDSFFNFSATVYLYYDGIFMGPYTVSADFSGQGIDGLLGIISGV